MATPELIVRGARLSGKIVDLLIAKGKVLDVVHATDAANAPVYDGASVLDAKGMVLLPSLIDAHAHLREPGQEYKETIATGLDAAAHGGFGTVFAMANTDPVNDDASVTEFMLSQAKRSWPRGPRLKPVGALTKGLAGKELAPMGELARAGCVAFSNDGLPVADSGLFRRAVEYAADLDKLVIDHCEDTHLAGAGVMNEGTLSGLMGLAGQPTVAEAAQVARDVLLSLYLNTPIHIAHVSSRESVELIDWAKRRGAPVTAETTPHHLAFNESRMHGYDPNAKVNPPLRSRDDVLAVQQGLSSGVIDMLATDHAPHAAHEKENPVDVAPFGVTGLDTALSLTWSLIADKVLDEATLVRAWAHAPAQTFGVPVNRFQPGDPADFVLLDPRETWTVDAQALRSKGKNSLCMGMALPGRVRHHYIAGRALPLGR